MKAVLAGAVTVFGLNQIKDAFNSLGFDVFFADTAFMVPFADEKEKLQIHFGSDIDQDAIVIPLSEFWISWCIKNGHCRISSRALNASRSKKFLYELLSPDSPKILEKKEAEEFIQQNKRIVIKPEGLHSGYGIEILTKENFHLFDKYIDEAKKIRNRTLRIMEIPPCDVMVTECIEGQEFSADCFVLNGRISVVRICRRHIIILNDKPCAAVIELVEPDEEFTGALSSWCNKLFDKEDISFAQFDFIKESDTGRIVPIDFACRVGGGMKELLSSCTANVYADAVEGKLSSFTHLYQLNYLSGKTGYVTRDSYILAEGKQKILKHKGDYVISNPSSVGSRVATVVTEKFNIEEIHSLILNDIC